ncbi:MAG: MFS transporter [Candidatus Harrisonbacteria bacterium]|nr:MFS transporter [Candidatus Harrisonbacteria bacterium]
MPSVNRVVRFFIFSDLILWSGWGFIDPLFSIFVVREIAGATLISVGVLAAIYWIAKGILQIPISLFLDKTPGERDDFYALVLGLLIIGISGFSFALTQKVWQVYSVQFIKAIGFALYIPSWSAILSRHLDKGHTAFEWALSSSSVSLGIGLAGLVGGSIATIAGFNFLFLFTGSMAILSAIVLIFVPDLILPRKTTAPILTDHVRAGIK